MTTWTPQAILQTRLDRRWSLNDAARELGVSRRTYIDWEQGRTTPDHFRLDRILGGEEQLTRDLLAVIRERDSRLPEGERRLDSDVVLIDPIAGITVALTSGNESTEDSGDGLPTDR